MNNTPLVSVVVVTYNSSEYIVELLESIYNQTYVNIELIISDDCSSDNTILLCKEWLNNSCKKTRFSNVIIVESEKNQGITFNYNKGYVPATGKYIKFIEGDDLLLSNCITDNVNYAVNNDERIIFSQAVLFGEHIKDQVIPIINPDKIKKYTKDSKKIYKRLLQGNIFVNPTIFVEKSLLIEYGGFSNDYKMLVDYPFFIKIAKNNEKFAFIEKKTVKYRQHNKNLSKPGNEKYVSEIFYNDMKLFYENELKYYLKGNSNFFVKLEVENFFYTLNLIVKNGNNLRLAKKYRKFRYLPFWFRIREYMESL